MWDLIRKTYIVVVIAAMLCSCEDSDENYDQREDIISFLESSHSPTLIAESEVAESLDDDPEFYSTFGTYAFRYISTYYDEGRELMPEVVKGSVINIYFDLFIFDGEAISSSDLALYSNKIDEILKLSEAGMNTEYWSFDTLEIKIGSDSILESIQSALIGCREGDEVYIYLTCGVSYGDDFIGLSGKESALRFSCTIESVEN